MKTKGMSSLNEDDVRRIFREELYRYESQLIVWAAEQSVEGIAARTAAYHDRLVDVLQATDTEPPATQATSEAPAEEGTPPWQERRVEDRRKRPEPKQYKEPTPCKDNT